jgi:hypothetical protein
MEKEVKAAGKTGSKKRSKAVWCLLIAVFGLTLMAGTKEISLLQSNREWTTITLPNPPAPLLDSAAPSNIR